MESGKYEFDKLPNEVREFIDKDGYFDVRRELKYIVTDEKGEDPNWSVWYDNNADAYFISLESTDEESTKESSYFRLDDVDLDVHTIIQSWNAVAGGGPFSDGPISAFREEY